MPAFRDLTGMRFGRLLVLRLDTIRSTARRKYWICQCDCGNIKSICSDALVSGDTLSCGCMKQEKARRYNKSEFDPQLGCYRGYYNTCNDYYLYDIEDKELVESYCWRKDTDGYAVTRDPITGKTLRMHRLILSRLIELSDDDVVDHINNITSDNRRHNLRKCTFSENARNKTSSGSNTGERYITFTGGVYQFRIVINGITYKKCFASFDDAKVYKNEFLLNHPDEFRYNLLNDVRNRDSNSIIHPFIFINPEERNKE